MRRSAVRRLGAIPACLATAAALVVTGLTVPAQAAAPGFDTQITELPGRFTAGDRAETISAVVSRTEGGGCLKVRWSLVLRVNGLRLDQVRVDRFEETGSFPVDRAVDGDSARLTDQQLDPGTLCPDRTVTARYRVAVADEVTDGDITIVAEAFDADRRLLAGARATREVVRERAAPGPARTTPAERRPADPTPTRPAPTEPEPTGSAPVEPTLDPEEPVLDDEEAVAGPDEGTGGGTGRTTPTAAGGRTGLVQLGFMIGGVLLFLGGGLLLRLRLRAPASEPATGRRRSGRADAGWGGSGWSGGAGVPARRRGGTARRARTW